MIPSKKKYTDSKSLIMEADKADNKVQRRASLLHLTSKDVQEIFETLTDTGGIKDFEKSEKALIKLLPHHESKFDIPEPRFSQHVAARRRNCSSICDQVKTSGKDCDYGEQAEYHIRNQVVQRCKSHALRRKLLEKGERLILELLLSMAANHKRV